MRSIQLYKRAQGSARMAFTEGSASCRHEMGITVSRVFSCNFVA